MLQSLLARGMDEIVVISIYVALNGTNVLIVTVKTILMGYS